MIGLIIRPDLQFRHLVFEIMRGKLKTSFLVSEDMALVEGAEVEIVDIRYGCETYYMCNIPSGIRIPIESNKIEITDYTPFADWNSLRREYACRAMQGILRVYCTVNDPERYALVAKDAVKYADALIDELRK